MRIHGDWHRLSKHDPHNDRGYRKPLLDGCLDGVCGRLFGLFMQSDVLGVATIGRSAAMVLEGRETGTFDRREIQAQGWKNMTNPTYARCLEEGRT